MGKKDASDQNKGADNIDTILAVITFFMATAWFTYLLQKWQLESRDYALLVIASGVFSIIFCFKGKIAELTLPGGTSIKMRHMEAAAEEILDSMVAAQEVTLRHLLRMTREHFGAFTDLGGPDKRLPGFLGVVEAIAAAGLTYKFKDEIHDIGGSIQQVQSGAIVKRMGKYIDGDGGPVDVGAIRARLAGDNSETGPGKDYCAEMLDNYERLCEVLGD